MEAPANLVDWLPYIDSISCNNEDIDSLIQEEVHEMKASSNHSSHQETELPSPPDSQQTAIPKHPLTAEKLKKPLFSQHLLEIEYIHDEFVLLPSISYVFQTYELVFTFKIHRR